MNFGISDNSCMFVTFNAKEQTKHISSNGHFLWLCVSYYLHDIRLSLPVRLLQKCYSCSLARMGGGSLSLYHKIKFHLTMPKNNENLTKGSVASLSSTPTSAKTASKSQSKLEKEIAAIQKKVATLQADCKAHEAEKYRLLCYIDRYCSCLLSNFLENNPLNSQDWKKLHKQQLDIKDAIK